jgi:hypothetical protein
VGAIAFIVLIYNLKVYKIKFTQTNCKFDKPYVLFKVKLYFQIHVINNFAKIFYITPIIFCHIEKYNQHFSRKITTDDIRGDMKLHSQ